MSLSLAVANRFISRSLSSFGFSEKTFKYLIRIPPLFKSPDQQPTPFSLPPPHLLWTNLKMFLVRFNKRHFPPAQTNWCKKGDQHFLVFLPSKKEMGEIIKKYSNAIGPPGEINHSGIDTKPKSRTCRGRTRRKQKKNPKEEEEDGRCRYLSRPGLRLTFQSTSCVSCQFFWGGFVLGYFPPRVFDERQCV